MPLDPAIVAIFGEPPAHIDLSEATTPRDNAIVLTLAVVAVLAIAGRVWARNIKAAPLWVDDYLIFLSMAMVLGTTAFTIVGGHYKSGHHIWAMNMKDFEMINQVLYGYTFIYGAAAACIKLSFIFYFVRVFHTGNARSVLGCHNLLSITLVVGGILAICYPLMVWITMLTVCQPIHYFWTQYSNPGVGSCGGTTLFFLAAGVINMVIDIFILMIPLPSILRLQVRPSDKFMLVGIFMLGGFVCVASIVRIYYLVVLRNSIDITWVMGAVFIWSSVEPSLGILSSCLISLRPVLKRIWSKIFGEEDTLQSGSGVTRSGRFWPTGDGSVARPKVDGRAGAKGGRTKDDDEFALVTITADGAHYGEGVWNQKMGRFMLSGRLTSLKVMLRTA